MVKERAVTEDDLKSFGACLWWRPNGVGAKHAAFEAERSESTSSASKLQSTFAAVDWSILLI